MPADVDGRIKVQVRIPEALKVRLFETRTRTGKPVEIVAAELIEAGFRELDRKRAYRDSKRKPRAQAVEA